MASWTKAITDPLNAASDLAQGLMKLRDLTQLGGVVVKLNAEILAAQRGALTAQQNEATMAEEIRELKAQIVSFETWDTEKKRYQLQELPPGVFVYTLKPEMAAGEPSHRICETCYQRGKKSILHAGEPGNGLQDFKCHECKTTFHTGIFISPVRPGRQGEW